MLVRQCCVCKKVEIQGDWVPAPEHDPAKVRTTHVYCPECSKATNDELEAHWARTPVYMVYMLIPDEVYPLDAWPELIVEGIYNDEMVAEHRRRELGQGWQVKTFERGRIKG